MTKIMNTPISPKDHLLFKEYALNSQATISTGVVPVPYHIYNGHGLFIGGTANLDAVRNLLKRETISPVVTENGNALMGIWVCNFTDASLGPHHELQFSFFVSRSKVQHVSSHPLTLLNLMLTHSGVQMLCHGLWNNVPWVVAYNRELLGLNAQTADSKIEHASRMLMFTFSDPRTNSLIFRGRVTNPGRSSLKANLALTSQVGFRRIYSLARQPWLRMEILNPVSDLLPRNAVAEAFSKNEVTAIQYFHSATHTLEFGNPAYRSLHFQPQFVQYMDGFKFVYLLPR